MHPATLAFLLLMCSVPLTLVLAAAGAVLDVIALRQSMALGGASLSLKTLLLAWFGAILIPGDPLGLELGYLDALPAFGIPALAVTVAFITLDVAIIRRLRSMRLTQTVDA